MNTIKSFPILSNFLLKITLFLFSINALTLNAQETIVKGATAIALRGEPKYAYTFTHFDYVNPDAPKGGSLTQASIGTFDSFHRYALRGNTADGYEYFYDTLLKSSSDEISSYYPLIAEKFDYAADYSFITFYINPNAKDQGGQPITAEDVAFSFNTFMTKGVPQFRSYYAGVTATILDTYKVRFDIPLVEGADKGDKEKMLGLCSLSIFPKRFWEGRDFSEPLIEPPLGTGVYRVAEYQMGQYVIIERVKDYWAKDLPVNKGQFNFDTIRYDYYRDETISLEAFKAGEYDFREETSAVNWATKYIGKNFDNGLIKKETIPHEIPQAMQALTFNIQRPIFADRRVRWALNYFFDFEWMNKNLFYGQYKRTRSYFQNTEYAADGLPSPDELAILEPVRGQIPTEVFTTEYQPSVTDGTGYIRVYAREALRLLAQAGWELKNGKLINKADGRQFSFELLIYSPDSERIAIPFQRNLAKYGIDMRIRMVDTSQFVNRLRSRDFDMIARGSPLNAYPSADMAIIWHSAYIDSTWNTPGVSDPSVDYLIERIMEKQEDESALLSLGRAVDRVLTWNFYVIPLWHISEFRLAYINKFARPAIRPKYEVGLDTWWQAKPAK
ncbi:MAG: extracellular solute-binding protein [Treponema sp.]|jgi:microcin C transport system substrate-binding protein|nr:extracellular solute-binding protein [Treponema sp.]